MVGRIRKIHGKTDQKDSWLHGLERFKKMTQKDYGRTGQKDLWQDGLKNSW